MQLTNFYSKAFLKLIFFAAILLFAANAAVAFTEFAVFPLPIHLALAGLFLVVALFLLTKDFFVKYDSRDDFVEVEHSRLFSDPRKPGPRFKEYLKYRIKDYRIEKRWYGSKLVLEYEELNGSIKNVHIPFTFFSKRHYRILQRDLQRVLDSDIYLFVGSGFRRPGKPA